MDVQSAGMQPTRAVGGLVVMPSDTSALTLTPSCGAQEIPLAVHSPEVGRMSIFAAAAATRRVDGKFFSPQSLISIKSGDRSAMMRSSGSPAVDTSSRGERAPLRRRVRALTTAVVRDTGHAH